MRRALPAIISLFVLFVVLVGIEIRYLSMEAISTGGWIYYLALLNLTVIALIVLVYLVGKNLYKLLIERRQKALGYRFKTRVVAIFLVLTSIPASLLFLGSSGLGTNYIERLFSAQYRQPIERSVGLAKSFYDMERNRSLHYARLVRSGFNPPAYYRVQRIESLPENASATIRGAFEGREETEVISGNESDTMRAAIPAGQSGIIVIESSISPEITRNINDIKTSYEDYIKLESWRTPLKLNYLLFLGLLTVFIIFSSLWFSLRISGWITEPVRSLAAATEEVAAGNLSVRVQTARDDEMGLLIGSFNRMVSELKEGKESLESAYQQSDHRRLTMENILENIRSGVVSLDSEGKVITINPAACRLLGLNPGALSGRYYTEILNTVESPELLDFIKGINIHTLESLERQLKVTIGGRKADMRVFVSGLRSAQGEYIGLLVVIDDLTDIIAAQRATAWQEAARRIAHEIKNPLTPIRLSAERVLKKWREGDTDFGGSLERSAETIIREVDGMKRLVDEFSKFGRMPALMKSTSDIGVIIEEVIALYGENLDISVASDGEIPTAELDAEQIRRVLINIFDNALHAMGGSGSLRVAMKSHRAENRIVIEVADEGPGVSDEDKERLFQPYFSTKRDGRGLGLAIAERIVAEHGGSIRVADNVPRGTIFTIELPLKG